jgi:hypothetical protein
MTVPGEVGARRGTPGAAEGSHVGTVVALGELALVEGYGLAGAVVTPAETDADVLRAWSALPRTVTAVVLTPRAAAALGSAVHDVRSPMSVVLP